MTVQSGWVGKSALDETGKNWMSEAGGVLRLGTPFWMSAMVGRSKELIINLDGHNHNFSSDWLVNHMSDLCGGNWNDQIFIINVGSGVQLVSEQKPGQGNWYGNLYNGQCMWFGGNMALCKSITINNSGYILGRGASAVNADVVGRPTGYQPPAPRGAHGIVCDNLPAGKLIINNWGVISGGGGASTGSGGTEKWNNGEPFTRGTLGGQGGAPFGLGGRAYGGQMGNGAGWGDAGNPAQAYESGNFRTYFGASGGWGQWGKAGGEGNGAGNDIGQPGAGVFWVGGSPNIPNWGDIRGGVGQ